VYLAAGHTTDTRKQLKQTERILQLQVDVSGQRLDRYLTDALPGLSRSQIQRLIREGQVILNGQAAKPNTLVESGMLAVVRVPASPDDEVLPQEMALDVIYEDDDLVAISKPAGMVVHPAHGHREGTLVNALLARYPKLAVGDAGRPGIVHRLDRDTSGLIVVAKTDKALQHLREQFKQRKVKKTYLALVHGRPPSADGIVEAPVGRNPRQRKRMAVLAGGRAARTSFHLMEDLNEYSLLTVSPETGRTHQIRVHLAWVGMPVVGDRVYGRQRNHLGLRRQFLHAWRLSFQRPGGKGRLDLESPLPPDLRQVLRDIGGQHPG